LIPVLLTSNLGIGLDDMFQYGISLDVIPQLDDDLRDKIGHNQTIDFIKANSERIPYLVLRKLGYFWGLERRALTYFYSNNIFGPFPKFLLIFLFFIFLVTYVIVSLTATIGFAMTKWNRSNILIGLVIVGYLIPHVLILAEDRFHLTLIPFLAIAAIQGWGSGGTLIKSRWKTRNRKIALIFAFVVSVLMIANWDMKLFRDGKKLALLFGISGNTTYFPY